MSIDRQKLQGFPLFEGYSEQDLDEVVLPHLETLSLDANEVICREREPGDRCFFLCDGVVSVELSLPTGKQEQIGRLEAGSLFGQITLLDGGTRSATCLAETECRLLTLNRPTFERLIDEGHRFAFDVLREIGTSLARQVRQATENLSAMSETSIEDPSLLSDRLQRFISGSPSPDILGKSTLLGLKLRKVEL